jgi:hypothetical protein
MLECTFHLSNLPRRTGSVRAMRLPRHRGLFPCHSSPDELRFRGVSLRRSHLPTVRRRKRQMCVTLMHHTGGSPVATEKDPDAVNSGTGLAEVRSTEDVVASMRVRACASLCRPSVVSLGERRRVEIR